MDSVFGDCSSNNWYSIGVATLSAVKGSEIVHKKCHIGMIGTKCLFFDRQRPLEQGLYIGITTLITVEHSQIVQR